MNAPTVVAIIARARTPCACDPCGERNVLRQVQGDGHREEIFQCLRECEPRVHTGTVRPSLDAPVTRPPHPACTTATPPHLYSVGERKGEGGGDGTAVSVSIAIRVVSAKATLRRCQPQRYNTVWQCSQQWSSRGNDATAGHPITVQRPQLRINYTNGVSALQH